jgi:hypothetical protein
LRDDLRTGELALNEFAADLYDVALQSGRRRIYEDPKEFFALTYPTSALLDLARDVVRRLAGKNQKAVRQLELTYGGGKTHTLITLGLAQARPASVNAGCRCGRSGRSQGRGHLVDVGARESARRGGTCGSNEMPAAGAAPAPPPSASDTRASAEIARKPNQLQDFVDVLDDRSHQPRQALEGAIRLLKSSSVTPESWRHF